MKAVDARLCRVHVLVCTNERTDGRTACSDFGGQEFFRRLKDKVKAEGLSATHWVNRTGCIGFCNQVGTTVKISRKGESDKWFTEVTAEDFEEIWKQVRGTGP